jgi:hypothetical protein
MAASSRAVRPTRWIAFGRIQIKIPSPQDHPGEKYLQAIQEALRRLALWLEESA